MDAGAEFVAVDNPNANKLTLHILAAVAQHEREMIGERTKAALQAAKARGVRLGRNAAERLAPANRQAAFDRAVHLAPIFSELRAAGLSARAMAAELIARGVPIPTGAKCLAARAKAKLRTFHATMTVTCAEEWCVDASSIEEAKALLESGNEYHCAGGYALHVEVDELYRALTAAVIPQVL
jgi:Resolvase, N terminal domain